MNTPTPLRSHRASILIIPIFLIAGLASALSAAETWVKVSVNAGDQGEHTTAFFYPKAEYSPCKKGESVRTALYLAADRAKKAKSWLTCGDKDGEEVSLQPEAGDKANHAHFLKPAKSAGGIGFERQEVSVTAPAADGGQGKIATTAEGKQKWKKITYPGPDKKDHVYYYPIGSDGQPLKSYRNNDWFGIDLYSKPEFNDKWRVKTHFHKLAANKPLTLDFIDELGGGEVTKGWKEEDVEVVPPPVTPGNGNTEVPNPGAGQWYGGDPNNPVNRIGASIGADYPARVGDMVNRILEYLWPEAAPAGRKSFIKDREASAPLRSRAGAALGEWAKVESNRMGVVTLYYGLGAGSSPPAWVTSNPTLKDLLTNPDKRQGKLAVFEKLLDGCLDRWAVDGKPGGSRPAHCSGLVDANQARTPLASDKANEWLVAISSDAAAEAAAILYSQIPADVLAGLIGGANQPPVVPGGNTGGPGGPGLPTTGMTGSFGVDKLFGKYGDPNVFMLDGRKLAMVLRTRREFEGKPPKAVFKQQIGLYDISNESEIYGRRFDLTASGEYTFPLKDGGKTYTLKLTPNGADTTVALARANGGAVPEFGDPSQKALLTVNQMFRYRAEQVIANGQRTVVNGKTYYVSGESSDKGALLFWSEDTLKAAQSQTGDPRSYNPEHLAHVNQKVGGTTQNLAGQVHLGQVNGKWMDLKYNDKTGIWESVDGTEPEVKAPPVKEGTGGTNPGTGNTNPGEGNTGEPNPGGDGKGELPGLDMDNPKRHFKRTGKFASRLNGKLPDALKGKVLFLENEENTVPGQGILVVANNDVRQLAFLPYAEVNGAFKVLTLDIADADKDSGLEGGRYLVTLTDKGVVYVDLKNMKLPDDAVSGVLKPSGIFKLEGGGNAVDKVRDEAVLRHLLLLLAKYPKEEVDKALANLKTARKDRNWQVFGLKWSSDKSVKTWLICQFLTGGEGARAALIYPQLGEEGSLDDVKTAAGAPPGKGILMDSVAGKNPESLEDLKDANDLGKPASNWQPSGTWEKVAVKEEKGAALFKVTRTDAADQYFLRVKITIDGKDKVQTPFLIFDQKDKDKPKAERSAVRCALPGGDPKNVSIAGLVLPSALPPGWEFSPKSLGGDDIEQKGFWAVYDGPGGKSPNCVGVVAWWGGSLEDACTACGGEFVKPDVCKRIGK